ncbi:MAG: hypothetical protein HOG34_05710, partial [Bacteroidetes bacterium]|nr:hypothetical protein [Bacteroidota bacterium]
MKSKWLFLLIFGSFFLLSGCQKEEKFIEHYSDNNPLIGLKSNSQADLYWGHQKILCETGQPIEVTYSIGNDKLKYFGDSFVLRVNNGADKKTRVASARIELDGIKVLAPDDLNKTIETISFDISNISAKSQLIIEVRGKPNTFIEVWIEGIDLRERIINEFASTMPEDLVNEFKAEVSYISQFDFFKEEIEVIKSELQEINTILADYYPGLSLENYYNDLYNSLSIGSLKSTESNDCELMNLGSGYAKGASVDIGASAGIAYVVGVRASGSLGTGCDLVFDFINKTSQVYIYKLCSSSLELLLGFSGEGSVNLGINTYVKWIFNIPRSVNSNSLLDGFMVGQNYSITGKVATSLGADLSPSIGFERELDCNVQNPNLTTVCNQLANSNYKIDGLKTMVLALGASGSVGPQISLTAGLKFGAVSTYSEGVTESFKDYKEGSRSRIKATLSMAKEILMPELYAGISTASPNINPYDLIAASAALLNYKIDVQSCPVISLPTIQNEQIEEIGSNNCRISYEIVDDGGGDVFSTGVEYAINQEFIDNDIVEINHNHGNNIEISIKDLLSETHYYSRAFAENQLGKVYSKIVEFDTQPVDSEDCIDSDGRVYETIQIGNQLWMAENLAYLPLVNSLSDGSVSQPKYYVYDYNGTSLSVAKTTDNYESYGVLYNWEAAKMACPEGWHLPNDEEWKKLEKYLGMNSSEVGHTGMRETGDVGEKLKS